MQVTDEFLRLVAERHSPGYEVEIARELLAAREVVAHAEESCRKSLITEGLYDALHNYTEATR